MLDEIGESTPSALWQATRFVLHLSAVYLLVYVCALQLAGLTYRFLLPAIQVPTRSSGFEFIYNHLLFFSAVPAFASGLANARFKHRVAQFVWVVPAIVLAYKLFSFPVKASLLEAHSWPSLHEYFAGGFSIPDPNGWNEFVRMITWNPDLARASGQLRFTAPFYAGLAYSFAAMLGLRSEFLRTALEKLRQSEARWQTARLAEPVVSTDSNTSEPLPGPPHAPVQ